jgi:subfamily B ATP-binding cassette protein MsbA
MTLGSLTVFLAYLAKFFKPVQELAKLSGSIAQAAVAVERVRGILDVDMSIPERPDARDPGPISGTITFDHVAFAYEPARPVLKDVSFSIRAGQSVGIVGTSGSGKSTLASLVARLYDVTGGRVLLDGVDVRHYKLHGLRQQFAFVLQETVLFRGTILDNIAYGRPGATIAEVIEAAKLANAHDFVSRLPKGYETVVGERGLTLSGGERQRIGIARALIRNAPILILDEPTSGLDLESERVVVEALERLMEGRTVITIAHRLGTLRRADSIVVLDGGHVAEKGTHDELLRNGGVYAKLHLLHGAGSRATHDPGRRKLHAVPLAAGAP